MFFDQNNNLMANFYNDCSYQFIHQKNLVFTLMVQLNTIINVSEQQLKCLHSYLDEKSP